ncbi:MAG: chemotaxis protein CheW, partial [Lachnospiraceae bacterium]|nr:chemotaxis protein CheW [Lachnospiraceae bacterium]
KTDNNAPIGLIVDEVREVVTLDERSIDEVIRDSKVDETYINGIGKNGETLISLLDLNAVISDKENS